MDLGALRKRGIGAAEIGRHYVYFNEFLYRALRREGEGEDDGRAMTVLDIGGLGLTSLTPDVLEVLRTTSHLMHAHYPGRVLRICVVNVPFLVGGAWRLLASVLPQAVQEKIEVSAQPSVDLLKYIAPENLPSEFGGTSPMGLGDSAEEKKLRALVHEGGKEEGREGGGQEEQWGGLGVKELGLSPSSASSSKPPRGPSASSSLSPASPPPRPSLHANLSVRHGNGPHKAPSRLSPWLPSLVTAASSLIPGTRRSTPRTAHLGVANKFIYDRARGAWVLREEEKEGDEGEVEEEEEEEEGMGGALGGRQLKGRHGTKSGTREDKEEEGREEGEEEEPLLPKTEEDGLVLAIQAAHIAEHLARRKTKCPSSWVPHAPNPSSHPRHASPHIFAPKPPSVDPSERGPFPRPHPPRSDADSLGDVGEPAPASAPSLLLVLQTTVLYLGTSLLHFSFLPMVPVWLASPYQEGGLGLTPLSLGLLLSLGTTLLFFLHAYPSPSFLRVPDAHPLRTFRLATVVLVASTVLICGLHPRMSSKPSSSPSNTITAGTRYIFAGIFYLVLLTAVYASLSAARAATTTLLRLVSPLPSGPFSTLFTTFASSIPAVGPLLGAWTLSWSLRAGLHYPMDTRLMWHVSALSSVGLYILSLQFQLVVTGDFGSVRMDDSSNGLSGNAFIFLQKKKKKRKTKRKAEGNTERAKHLV
jgi:hypothetical protein